MPNLSRGGGGRDPSDDDAQSDDQPMEGGDRRLQREADREEMAEMPAEGAEEPPEAGDEAAETDTAVSDDEGRVAAERDAAMPDQPTEGGDRRLQRAEQQQRREAVAEGSDVDAENIAAVEQTVGTAGADQALFEAAGTDPEQRRLTGRLTEERRRELARNQIVDQNENVDPGDIERLEETDGGYEAVIDRPDRGELSPLAALSVPEGRVETAQAGEEAIERRAESGNRFAQGFEAGVSIQEAGRDVADVAEAGGDRVLDSPLPAAASVAAPGTASQGARAAAEALDTEVGRADAAVSEQVSSTAGGFAEFPFLVGGGAVSANAATGLAVEEAADGEVDAGRAVDDFAATSGRAAGQQAALVRDRPVEAALILAPAAVSSGRARVRARSESSGRTGRTEAGDPGITESRSARTRARQAGRRARNELETLAADESAQAQLGGRQSRSQSRGESGSTTEPAGRRTSPDLDPRVFERNRGRGPGRSEGISPEIGNRPGRGERSGFREDVQRARQLPEQDLRQATEFDPVEAGGAASPSGAPGAPAGVAASEAVERLADAQQPQVQTERAALDPDAATQPSVDPDTAAEPSIDVKQATEPELEVDLQPRPTQVQRAGARDEIAVSDQRLRVQNDRAQSGATAATPPPDVRTRSDAKTAGAVDEAVASAADGRLDTEVSQDPSAGTRRPTDDPGRPRPPGWIPDLPGASRGREFDAVGDGLGPLTEQTVENPVAAPGELDEVAAEALGDADDRDDDPLDVDEFGPFGDEFLKDL
jgi:hypothetical protein